MTNMKNGISLVLVGVFWVCKAYSGGIDVFEEDESVVS